MQQQYVSLRRHVAPSWLVTLSALGIVATASAFTLSGCGSDSGTQPIPEASGNPSDRSVGKIAFKIQWPERTSDSRLIPSTTESIRVVVTTADSQTVADKTIDRAAGDTSEVTLQGIPAGDVTVTATAYPEAGAAGTAQARGSVVATVIAGQTAQATLTMGTTITRIGLSPTAPRVSRGGEITLVATAYDDQNRVVLTNPDSWEWTRQGSAVTITADDEIAHIRGGSSTGTATVRARETEANIQGEVTVTVVDGVGLAQDTWGKARGDAQNSGRGPTGVNAPLSNPEAVWTYTSSVNLSTAPIVGPDGTVYVGTTSGTLLALDPADGTVQWQYATSIGGAQGITAPPVLTADTTLYLPAFDGSIRSLLAKENPTVKWTVQPGQTTVGPTVGPDGTVYVQARTTSGEIVRALKPGDGSVKWSSSSLGNAFNSGGAIALNADGSTLYVSSANGIVAALRASDGDRRWTFTLADRPLGVTALNAAPAVGTDGAIYLGAADGYIRSITSAGASRWAFKTGVIASDNTSSAAGFATGVALSSDGASVYAGGEDNTFYALRTSNGNKIWSKSLGDATAPVLFSAPAVDARGTVYVVVRTRSFPSTARVLALDPADGDTLWELGVETLGNSAIPFDPAIGRDGRIYVASGNKVYAIRQK